LLKVAERNPTSTGDPVWSEGSGDPLPISPQFFFVIAFHEFPDIIEQLALVFGKSALHMEQIGGVLVHEDCVVVQAANKLMDFLQLFHIDWLTLIQ